MKNPSKCACLSPDGIKLILLGEQTAGFRAGALIDDAKKWKSVDWKHVKRQVRWMQVGSLEKIK
jgi:hypothetical protein